MALATIEQIATVLNMTPRMINKHAKENGMPRVSRGEYDLVKCVHWYVDFLKEQIDSAKRGDESEQQARGRLTIAQANMKEIDLARMKAEVITVDDAIREVEDVMRALRAHFLFLPRSISGDLVSLTDVKEIEQFLTQRIHESLIEATTLPDRIKRIAENQKIDSSGDLNTEAAHETDGVGVGGPVQDPQPGGKRSTRAMENTRVSKGNDGRGKRSKG